LLDELGVGVGVGGHVFAGLLLMVALLVAAGGVSGVGIAASGATLAANTDSSLP